MTVFITFWRFVVSVLCLPIQLFHLLDRYKIYKRIFPFCIHSCSIVYGKKMREKKRELFRSLSDFSPSDSPLTILEIGCGSGTNFEFYPPGSRVICTDLNPHFERYLAKNMDANDHLTYERFLVTAGEDMGSVTDGSVDVVVSTLVLCSVSSQKQTLREVLRILRPGGAFFYIEHVVADPSTWTHFFQQVFQPLFTALLDGCHMTRATWTQLEDAGFSELSLRHTEAPLFFLIKPHVEGYAVK